jgi:hypothetical protein
MHESYDDYDDGYDDSHDYDDEQPDWELSKFYFKFDIGNKQLYNWIPNHIIDDIINNSLNLPHISGFPNVSLPVNSYFSNTANGGDSILYLGNNYQNQPIWKTKYFIKDSINIEYKNHVNSHAGHFIKQPVYYKALFYILN